MCCLPRRPRRLPLPQPQVCCTSIGFFTIYFLSFAMATLNRRPLANRSTQACSPLRSMRVASGSKRARSPDPFDTSTHNQTSKRVKSINPPPAISNRNSTRDKKHVEREQQKAEFRDKYTRAFPGFIFCFDEQSLGAGASEGYRAKIELLGAVRAAYSLKFSHNSNILRKSMAFSQRKLPISLRTGHLPGLISQLTKRTIQNLPVMVY